MRLEHALTATIASVALLAVTGPASTAVKQLPRPGGYQIVTSGDGTRAWRINTLTGEMLYCSPEENSDLPVCKRIDTPPPRGGEPAQKKY